MKKMTQSEIDQLLTDYSSKSEQIRLANTDLQGADLRGADLRYSNLRNANLRGADLRYSNLRYSNLRDNNLRGADLRYSDLRGADLKDTIGLSSYLIVPTTGSFVGWKKLKNNKVIRLQIPASAQRINAIGSRKCRCSCAIPLDYCGESGNIGTHYNGCSYAKNEKVYPDSFDPDIRIECSHGIHFFMTREESEAWE